MTVVLEYLQLASNFKYLKSFIVFADSFVSLRNRWELCQEETGFNFLILRLIMLTLELEINN